MRDRILHRRELPLVGLATGLLVAATVAPTGNGATTCVLRVCTGTACPGCGMSRATGNFMQGNFAASWDYHPYFPLLLVQVVVLALWRLRWGNKPLDYSHGRIAVFLMVGNALALALIWLVRLATGHIDHVY